MHQVISMALRDLCLEEEYRTNTHRILEDFYIRCLVVSTQYDRAVGYFTSSGLSLAASGIVEFVRSGGGKMRLIASPQLTPSDIEEIESGYAEREEIISKRMVSELSTTIDQVEAERIATLGWLVANDILDIRIAFRTNLSKQGGIYHEKVGIFYDSSGDSVAFTGSPNETRGGLVSNFECIDVFTSWELPSRVQRKKCSFEEMWENRTTGLEVTPFPRVAKERLIQLATRELPMRDPELDAKTAKPPAHQLRYYQQDAIEFWKRKGYKAVLSMATGTGKTFTALRAVEHLIWNGHTVIVIVPKKILLKQWRDTIEGHFDDPLILECRGGTGWRDSFNGVIHTGIKRVQLGSSMRPLFIIATIHTASDDEFVDRVNAYAEQLKLVIIVDETHWLGATQFFNATRIAAKKRLGLSATPRRAWDEEGTSLLLDYFDKNVFEYSLKQAIEDKVLVPYDYVVREVELTQKEYEQYVQLSKKIARMMASSKDPEEISDVKGLDKLLFKRASLVKAAAGKREFVKWVHESFAPEMCLVYCENIDHLREVAKDLSDLGQFTVSYHSKLPESEKPQNLSAFVKGVARYLVSVGCLDEGIDIPDCRSAIILSSSRNKREFLQRRGRVLRRAPEKTKATIFDPIVIPDPSKRLTGAGTRALLERELERFEAFAEDATELSKVYALEVISKIRETFRIVGGK